MKRMFATVVVVFAIAACATGQGVTTGSAAFPTPAPTPTMRPSDAPPSAMPSPSYEVNGERIAAGRHTARPFDPAVSDHGACAGQSGCTESSADDSIRISFTVPDGWALGEEVAVTKPSAGRRRQAG